VGELAALVAEASSRGQKIKAVGSGHSFTSAAATDGRMIRLTNLSGISHVDRSTNQVTVGAGTRLSDLNTLLHAEGLALANLGDIAYQTVAGAISTSTHGTGTALTGLAGQVVGMTLVNGHGEIVECSETSNADVLDVGRVSVGALGVVSEYTLQAVPSFRLRALEQPMRLDDVLENVHDLAAAHDHFEFFWIPHTKWALTKRNNRTDDELQPLPRIKGWIEKTFMENYAFGALCRVGRARPSLIPRLATALPSSGAREYVDQSFKIFASPRIVRFYEMEHALPVDAVAPALKEIREMIERKGYLLNFPVEVRFTKGDDVALSTAYGRDSAYIAVHVYKGMECEPFFAVTTHAHIGAKCIIAMLKNCRVCIRDGMTSSLYVTDLIRIEHFRTPTLTPFLVSKSRNRCPVDVPDNDLLICQSRFVSPQQLLELRRYKELRQRL
jgi:L-gulonolactone oxidase